jgi:hypothetical protein
MPSVDGVGYEVERIPYQISQDRKIYLAKKPYETAMKLLKKVSITEMKIVDAWIPYLLIKYETLVHRCKGEMMFNDIGPRPPKPKKEPKPKPEKKPKIEKPLNRKA